MLIFLGTPVCCARYSALRNMLVGLYIYQIYITFLGGLVEHIDNKNQSVWSNFYVIEKLYKKLLKYWAKHFGSSIICSSTLCQNEKNKWRLEQLLSLHLIIVLHYHISSGCSTILIPSMLSSQNVLQRKIVVDCWQYAYSYEILKRVCKSSHKYKRLVLISNFFQLEIELYCEKSFCTHLDHVSKVEANKKWK